MPVMDCTVLPAGVLDASHATDSIILAGWVLDKPVDPARVKAAWSALVAAWPLLVARLRRDPQTQRWEYHIPNTPTLKNSFASIHISAPIRKHYTYATSPPTPTISVTHKQNPHHLYCPYGPTSVADLLSEDEDRPLVHLHVTSFDDGALVGLATPHILCDGHGVTAIVRALCALINGAPPPPPLDYTDPFVAYAPRSKHDDVPDVPTPAPPHWRVLNKLEILVFVARSWWAGLWEDKIENRDVYFPKEEVVRIKAEAMDDIRRTHGAGTRLYVSSSDAVLAFCLKCTHPGARSRAPLNVFYTSNMRPFLSSVLRGPYLRNTVLMPITPPLPLYTIPRIPLGELALHIRNTVTESLTEKARERWLRWRLKHGTEGRVMVFFSPWRGAWDVVTNWREMGLMNMDFSGALAGDYQGGTAAAAAGAVTGATGAVASAAGAVLGTRQPGTGTGNDSNKATTITPSNPSKKITCVYAWGNGVQPYAIKNWIGLWADDARGGIWTSGFLQRRVWEDKRGFGKFIRD